MTSSQTASLYHITAMVWQCMIMLLADILTLTLHTYFVLMFVSCTGPSDYGLAEYRRDMANLRAMINNPAVISTTTLQEMGSQANNKPKVEVPLPQVLDASWESPIWAQVTCSSDQLPEAEKGQKKGLQSLFAQLLPSAQSTRLLCFMMFTQGPPFAAVF